MIRPSSSSNSSRLPLPAAPILLENGEEAAGVVQTSPQSISLLRPPILTSEVWFLTYFSCSSCLLGRIGSILSVDRAIVSDPTVRSGPNLQDKCPIPYRTHRNFRIGIWRSWAPWACLTRVRVVLPLVDRESPGVVSHSQGDYQVSRGVGYPALRQAPYVVLVVPASEEIL
ncbi:hypothetical protein L3X38_024650 [Prunus dulcis]|uniref:Uncharacterized protein n=1 Tax=Prunus dulcis TaxID=3755 RepID=A0AAD4W2Y3_PRUDU|nr:hypothetical protein L3X38_024650 [Prunus dulcis]